MRLKHSLTLLSALTAVTSASAFAASVEVLIPCKENYPNSKGLRSCAEVLNGTSGKKGMIDLVLSQVKSQVDGNPAAQLGGYYQGVDRNIASPHMIKNPYNPSTGNKGYAFGPTLCNLVPGEFNSQSESSTNHAGKSCGLPVTLKATVKVIYEKDDPKCAEEYEIKKLVLEKKAHSDPAQSTGTLEDGFIRGSLVAATSCFYRNVTTSLRQQRKITVADIGGAPSPCAALGDDLQGLGKSFKKNLESFQAKLDAQPNLKDMDFCEKSWDEKASQNPDVGPLRQSAQQLCAARMGMEGMVTQLAACEILARSSIGWNRNFGDPTKFQALLQYAKDELGGPCKKRCEKKFENRDECSAPTEKEIEDCGNGCYSGRPQHSGDAPGGRLIPGFKKKFEQLWPTDGSKCDLGSADSPSSWVGAIGAIAWRRRKKKAARSRRSRLRAVAAVFFAYVGILVSGCADSDDIVPQIRCDMMAPGQEEALKAALIAGGTLPDGCEPQETPPDGCPIQDPANPKCNSQTPGGGGAFGPMDGAADLGRTVGSALDSANSLLGDEHTEQATGGQLSQGEAAKEGEAMPLAPGISKGGGGASGGGNTGTQGRRGGGGGGTGGGGSSGFGLGGNIATAPAKDAGGGSGAEGETLAATTGEGGTYKGGGAGGDSSGAGPGYGSRGNGMDGDASGAAVSEKEYAVAGATGHQIATYEDPADYFTRLGLNDSLFKVVERRYRNKSTGWVTDELLKKPGALK